MNDTVTIPTSELEGAALDWAVGIADGRELELPSAVSGRSGVVWCEHFEVKLDGKVIGHDKARRYWKPSTDWNQGGPLIDKILKSGKWEIVQWEPGKKVAVQNFDSECLPVDCVSYDEESMREIGETVLIAACRAIVAAHLGDSVQVPAELVGGVA